MGIPEITPYPMPEPGELPESTARWSPDPRRAVLLIHDMQRYFLRPFGGRAPLPDLVRNAALIRERCVRLGVPVAYTAQPGGMTPEQRGLLADFWGPGMTVAPEQRGVVPELAPEPADWMLTKWRYSAFHRTELLDRLRDSGRDQLICCGVYAHVGLLMTTVDALTYDIRSFLVADAVADFSADFHRLALEYAATRSAVFATTSEVLSGLDAAAPLGEQVR
jgi:trans-2,3-dihydro-3-hydroxyanthranilic acid synthase